MEKSKKIPKFQQQLEEMSQNYHQEKKKYERRLQDHKSTLERQSNEIQKYKGKVREL